MAPRACERRGLGTGGDSSNARLRLPTASDAMSVQYNARCEAFEVRWRVNDKHRSRLFTREIDAKAFDAKIRARKRGTTANRQLREVAPAAKLRQQVYVIEGGDAVKIGIATDPARRLAGLQTGSPTHLRLLWQIVCPDARNLEAVLHARYQPYRSHGEWYAAAPVLADLAALAALGPCRFDAVDAAVVDLECEESANA
jgi:hypothetical protein